MSDGKRWMPWRFGYQERRDHPQQRSYYQLLGLYDSLPASVLANPENEGPVRAFAEARQSASEKLIPGPEEQAPVSISSDLHRMDSSDLHRMELALVRLLPSEDLIPRLGVYRDEFRNLCGEDVYSAYLESHGYTRCEAAYDVPEDGRFIRADAVFLLGQGQRYNSMHERAEGARSYMLRRLSVYTMAVALVLLLPVALFLLDSLYLRHTAIYPLFYGQAGGENPASRDIARLALFGFAGLAGVLGAFVSALQRVQQLSASRELARHVIVLRSSATQLKWAPITGVISSGVFAMLVSSELLLGDLFPAAGAEKGAEWTGMLYAHSEFAKLMVWCFIAGFSERLVPDLLDRLLANTRRERVPENASPPPPTDAAPGRPVPPPAHGAPNGTRALVRVDAPQTGAGMQG